MSELRSSELERLIGVMDEVDLPAGEVLVHQGDAPTHLYVVLEGRLAVVAARPGGGEHQLTELDPGALVGEIAHLMESAHTAEVRALTDAMIARLPRTDFEALLADDPGLRDALLPLLHRRLRRTQLAVHLGRFLGPLPVDAVTEIASGAEDVTLPGGEVLFRQGDESDGGYVVLSGRLRVVDESGEEERVLRELGPGESLGMGVITLQRRSATVYAVRDAELARFPQKVFDAFMERHPWAMRRLTLVIAQRLQSRERSGREAGGLRTLTVVPASSGVPLEEVCRRLETSLSKLGPTLHLTAERTRSLFGAGDDESETFGVRTVDWLSQQEANYRYLLYQSDERWSAWTERALRQADQVLIVGKATEPPEQGAIERQMSEQWRPFRSPRISLALLHESGETLRGTARWLEGRRVRNHFHLRRGSQADFDRLARTLTGHAFGLVLGGGGARALGALGVLRVLEEIGLAVDMVGGSSFGAVVGAFCAMGLDAEKIQQTCRRHLHGLFDPTFPLVSLLAGRRIVRRLEAGFGGETCIEELPLPFFCVSTNLTRAQQVVHRRGSLVTAIRSSISLPGMLPPVCQGGELYVDGGLLNNVPMDLMQELCGGGLVVAVDASPARDLTTDLEATALSGWRLLAGRLLPLGPRHRVPSLPDLLARATVVSSIQSRQRMVTEGMADLYLQLPLSRWGLFEFDALLEMAEHGYHESIGPIREWAAARSSDLGQKLAVAAE